MECMSICLASPHTMTAKHLLMDAPPHFLLSMSTLLQNQNSSITPAILSGFLISLLDISPVLIVWPVHTMMITANQLKSVHLDGQRLHIALLIFIDAFT